MVSPPKSFVSLVSCDVIAVLVILSVKRSYHNASLNVEKLTGVGRSTKGYSSKMVGYT